ncbi:vitamin K epoxide reductase family protein [Leptolyngbya sp. AN02str]|uniref:vitamin K epoxide reductase family protein n=1 Tax=Leptolyngbya sp. AN02str TaxID=3423363 RepID=UPI003D315FBC
MARRRQTPWLHRWSRYFIGAIAILGALNTAYLTATKLFGGETVCPTSGCEQVLSSPYAEVFGQPLALFGLLAYLAMAAFAFAPMAVNPDKDKALHNKIDNTTWLLLLAGSTAMLVFSLYLMYIMYTKFVLVYGPQAVCFYCIASAVFALGMFTFTLLGRSWDDIGQLLFTSVLVGMITLVGTLGVFSGINGDGSTAQTPGFTVPAVTTVSGPAEIQLAEHLKQVGAVMYGAYWCPHCHDQKQLFGETAAKQINYVECAPDGANSQTSLCQSKTEVRGYPSWEINGTFYAGTQTLQQLAEHSGYTGPTNFQNSLGFGG